MFRIDNSTAVASLPLIPPVGTPGYFFRGDEVADVPATIVDDWWANTVQEEILTVVINAGLIPNKNDHTQLWQAIASLASGGEGGPDYDPYLPLIGGTLYQPLASDILTIAADPGYYARMFFTATGTRTYAVGVGPTGLFGIFDVSGGRTPIYIETTGRVIANNGLAVSGILESNALNVHGGSAVVDGSIASGSSVTSVLDVSAGRNLGASNNVYCNHNLFVGVNGINLYDEGGNYLAVSSNLDVTGHLQSAGFTCLGNGFINGNLSMGSQIQFAGGANALQYVVGGAALVDFGNFRVTGNTYCDTDLIVGQGASVTQNLFVGGNGSFGFTLTANQLIILSNAQVNTDLEVFGGLVVHQAASVTQNLLVGGNGSFGFTVTANQLLILSNAQVNLDLEVFGGIVVHKGAAVTENLLVGGNGSFGYTVTANQLLILSNAQVNTDFAVFGSTALAHNTQVGGDLSVLGSSFLNNIYLQPTSIVSWATAYIFHSGTDWVNINRNLEVVGDLQVGSTSRLNGSAYMGADIRFAANASASWVITPIVGPNHLEFYDQTGNLCCFQLHNATQRALAFKDLECNGNLIYHGGLINASDIEIKRDVQPYSAGLAEVIRLSPVSYEFDPTPLDLTPDGLAFGHAAPGTTPHGRRPEGRHVGLMAQDVEPVIPEMIMERFEIFDGGEPIKFLRTDMLNYVLINAVKELAARLDALEGGSRAEHH